MVKIYFDKQIFSYLFKQKEKVYMDLLEKIYNHKTNFMFCYSDAHIQDLKNDKTDTKYRELDFMKTIVDNNYISYNRKLKSPICLLAYPREVFDCFKTTENLKYEDVFGGDVFDESQKESMASLKAVVNLLKGKLPLEPNTRYGKIVDLLPSNANVTTHEMFDCAWGFYNMLIGDKEVYKAIRSIVHHDFNSGYLISENSDLSFNKKSEDISLKTSYIEFVLDCLGKVGVENPSEYDFYIMAYTMLDISGINKERAKTIKFGNMNVDGSHSYFGSLCDCIVSDDDAFIGKTRMLYRLLNIKTEVYHITDFLTKFDLSIQNQHTERKIFFDDIFNDFDNGRIIREDSENDIAVMEIATSKNYLGYFNNMRQVTQDGISYLLLTKEMDSRNKFIFYKEIAIIIDKLVQLMGIDDLSVDRFDWQKDPKTLNKGKWRGRFWEFKDVKISLSKIDHPYGLSMIIVPKNN